MSGWLGNRRLNGGRRSKGGGEFYTPRSVVKLLVEMFEPLGGRVYDGCCGSGGMFIQAERFIQAHGGRRNDIAVYGQELNDSTWRLAKMNLAIRGIESDLGPRWGDSFHEDLHPDYILANPPVQRLGLGRPAVTRRPALEVRLPPAGNANYAWLQHFVSKLSPRGVAGIVLANGSLSTQQSGEGGIRRRLLEGDLVECNRGAVWAAVLQFPVPPKEAPVLRAAEDLISRAWAAERETEQLAALRDALLPPLMDGRLRVRDLAA